MTEQEKPDAIVRVNNYDVTLYRRGRGLLINVTKDDAVVGFFGIADGFPVASVPNLSEQAPAPVVLPSQQTELSTAPNVTPVTAEKKTELNQPVKLTGIIASIEGMGQTPTTGDPVFRFSVKTSDEEIKQIAAFRHIGQTLDQLTRSPDPNIKLSPGRPISMMAFDHTEKTGSYYPSLITYLNLPAIINPKRR